MSAAVGFTSQQLLEAPAGFCHPLTARFQDVDAAGIVFYPRVLEYCHDAYVAFLAAHGHPLHQVLAERRWAAPLRHAEADYLRPIRFGDALEVLLVRARLEGSVLSLGYRLLPASGGAPLALAQTVHVFVDPVHFKRLEPPADLAAAFRRLGAETP